MNTKQDPAAPATVRGHVDPRLYTVAPRFGVAGGPEWIRLTSAGVSRAYSVGARLREDRATYLCDLVAAGGSADLITRDGPRARRTAFGAAHGDMVIWYALHTRGMVEHHGRDGWCVTKAGMEAHERGMVACDDLIARVRHERGV